MSNLAYVGIIIILLLLSAYFSGSEASFSALNLLRLKRHNDEKPSKKQSFAVSIKEKYDYYIIPLLLGNNTVNLLLSNVLTLLIVSTLGESWSFLSTIISVTLLLIVGEITPKLLGTKYSERWAVSSSPIIKFLSWLMFIIAWPLYKLLKAMTKNDKKDNVTQEELEAALDKSNDSGLIDDDKKELIQNAITLDETCAYEVCTPRINVKGIDIESEQTEWINTAVSSEYSRLPVYEGSLDNPKGTIFVRDYLKWLIEHKNASEEENQEGLLSLITPPIFVHHTMKVDDVYKLLNKEKNHIAFVSDEWGGTYGIITMDDALEELVGEIWDEDDDKEDGFEMNDDGTFTMNGTMTIKDLFLALDIDEDEDEFESITVGGLAIEMLNAFPHEGDTFSCKNINFTVLETEGRRVVKLMGFLISDKTETE